MSDTKRPSRRDFLKGSTALAAGAALTGPLSIGRSAHAAGPEQIKVALIGCGGRGTGAAVNCLNVKDDIKLVAVADAFEDNAQRALGNIKRQHADKVDVPPDRVFAGFDAYRKAIDCGVDMVILATSPGFRPIHHAAAIKAGKHVFMEKPCCTDAPGFRMLMETNKLADEKGLKVVVGLQRRHDPRYQETIQRIQDGALGDLMLLRAYWNGGGVWIRGRKPEQTEMEYQMRNWYYFVWLCGDHICEQHVHNLDVVNWARGDHPAEANGMGGRQVRTQKDTGQIYDHHFIEFTYADGTKMYSQCRHQPNTWSNVSEAAHGTKGTSSCCGWIKGASEWSYKGKGVNPFDQEHVDLVGAIRRNEKLNDGWHGATSSFTAVLGRMATYSGKVVKWDEAAAKGPEEVPYGVELTFQTKPPVVPDADGNYPVAQPGVYKPY